jgi:hypothetical protein
MIVAGTLRNLPPRCRARELGRWQTETTVPARMCIMRVVVANDAADTDRVPLEVASGAAFWSARTAALCNAHAIAASARELQAAVSPSIFVPEGTPAELSFFLTAASCLQAPERYLLLCAPTTVVRLQMVRHSSSVGS